jgi:hypothetical protein
MIFVPSFCQNSEKNKIDKKLEIVFFFLCVRCVFPTKKLSPLHNQKIKKEKKLGVQFFDIQ